jgi:hypothetical protein
MRHGTYGRRTPVGMRIARYYCPTAHETFSLLPDCLASHFPGALDPIEQVVATVEAARSVEAAADVLRPDITLPSAVRWVRRRLTPVRCALVAVITYHMAALTREELAGYLTHRLRLASAEVPLFDPSAAEAIYQATAGLPRKINLLAHHTLLPPRSRARNSPPPITSRPRSPKSPDPRAHRPGPADHGRPSCSPPNPRRSRRAPHR